MKSMTIAVVLLVATNVWGRQTAGGPSGAPARPTDAPAPKQPPKTPSKPGSPTKPSASSDKSKATPKSDDPKILTAEEEAARRSPLLQLPEEGGKYGSNDLRDVPPWRQTSFFGVKAKGQTFVYVVDCSESMLDGLRLIRAKRELRRSILSLQFPQKFRVIFYNDEPVPMPGDLFKSADQRAKDQLIAWLRLIEPSGGTDPRLALKMALGMRPDAVFLLSDGAFPDGTAADIAASNKRKTPIHCIDLSGGAGGEQLKAIATASGGSYASRP